MMPTIAASYNKPYHRELIEDLGFEKEVDYFEHRFKSRWRRQMHDRVTRKTGGPFYFQRERLLLFGRVTDR